MKRLPPSPAPSESSKKKIKFSESEVQVLIEQEVNTAVKKNEAKLQDLIETIKRLDHAVNYESTMQTLEARISAVTEKAEKAIAHMTRTQKKSQPPSLVKGYEDEAMETTSSHIDQKNVDNDRRLNEIVETTKEALKNMQADNEALKAAIADFSETPPLALSPRGPPELKHVRFVKQEAEDEQEVESHVQEQTQSEELERLKVEAHSPHESSEHADTERDTHSFPPLPDNTFPSILSMEATNYNIPQKPDVHLALIRNPAGLSVLWNVDDQDPSAPPMDCYFVYMTMENDKGSGVFRQWNCLGELRPLPMPMCVMVRKYKPGLKVCVAVVGKDKFGRFGPYSRIVTAVIPEDKIKEPSKPPKMKR